jgi:hypothetical protein
VSSEAFGTATVVPPVPPFSPFIEENIPRTNQLLPTDPAFTGIWVTLIGAGAGGGCAQAYAGSANYSGAGGGGGGAFIPRVYIPKSSLNIVGFDSAGAGYVGTSASPSWSHTITGNCLIIPVLYSGSVSGGTTATCKVGSTTVPLLGSVPDYHSLSGTMETLLLFGMMDPPTGVQTITLSYTGISSAAAGSMSYLNVASIGTPVTATGTGTALSLTVPSAAGNMVVNAFSDYSSTFSAYSQTSRTLRNYVSGSNFTFQAGDAPGAASVPFAVTASAANPWGGIGVTLTPAVATTYSVNVASAGGRGATAALATGIAGAATVFSAGGNLITAGGGQVASWNIGGAGGIASGAAGASGTAAGGGNAGGGGSAGTSGPAVSSGGAGGGGGGGASTLGTRYGSGAGGAANGQAGGAGGAAPGNPGSSPVAGLAGSGAGGGNPDGGTGGDAPGYGGGGGGSATFITTGTTRGGNGGPGYSKLEFVSTTPAQIAFADAGAGNATGNVASVSWSHTITGNCLVVCVQTQVNNAGTVTAKVGSTTIPNLVAYPYRTDSGYVSSVQIFGLMNPPTGSQTITVTNSAGAMYSVGDSTSYTGVTGFGVVSTVAATAAAMSQSVLSGYNQMVVQVFGGYTATLSAYTGGTQRYLKQYTSSLNTSVVIGDSATQSLTFGATQSAAQAYGGAAVVLLN